MTRSRKRTPGDTLTAHRRWLITDPANRKLATRGTMSLAMGGRNDRRGGEAPMAETRAGPDGSPSDLMPIQVG